MRPAISLRERVAVKRYDAANLSVVMATQQVAWFRSNGVALGDVLRSIGMPMHGMSGWDDAVEALTSLAAREGYGT